MKHKLSRRLGALLLTLALSLSLVVPAWADTTLDAFTVTLERDTDPASKFKDVEDGTHTLTAKGGERGGVVAKVTAPTFPSGGNVTYGPVTYEYRWSLVQSSPVLTFSGNTQDQSTVVVVPQATGEATVKVTVTATWSETNKTDPDKPVVTQKNATKEAEFKVKVLPNPVTGVRLNKTIMELPAGSTETLVATVEPNDATYKTVTWSSDPEKVAKVDQNGKVTGVAKGKATITATAGDNKTATCEVTVTDAIIHVDKIELKPTALEVEAGKDAEALEVTFDPEESSNKSVTWTSSNNNVASVNNKGVVHGVKAGKATITATTADGGKPATCEVTVKAAGTTGVTISGGKYTDKEPLCLDIGAPAERLIAVVSPPGAVQTVKWTSADEKIAKVDSEGNVTAVGVGKTTIKATSTQNEDKFATCPVEVSGVTLSGYLTTMGLNQKQPLVLDSIGNARENLKRSWTSSNPAVASVDEKNNLIARGIGTATISLTCTSSNGTVYPVEPDTFTVTVEENSKTIYNGNATAGAPYEFSGIMSRLDDICRDTNGNGLRYITNVSVPTDEGVMYYNHVSNDDTGFGVGSTERYYFSESVTGERYMSGLTFVPNSEFNGETNITYTGYDTKGQRYLGKIRLNVTGSGNVTFITKSGEPLTLSSTGFSAASRSETGREISSVSFVLPDASKGVLGYGYSGSGQYRYEVTAGEKYYRSRMPYLDQVSFIPAEYYIGTLNLPFYGEDTAGNTFTGKMYIIVSPNRPDGERSELTTTALRGTTVDFDKFDFEAACKSITGESLSYVRFTPPASSVGKLYYNYTSSGKYDSLVNANTRYYPSRSPRLDDLTFVPDGDRIQPVNIDFVGYTTGGSSFDGTVTIYYRDAGSADDVISYAVTSGQAIPFEPADFDAMCENITGKSLSRIQFQYLPDSSQGTLFRNYNSGSSTGTKVTTKDSITRSSLSGVAFAPKSDYTGTVELEFNGYASDDSRFTGTVRIDVDEGNTTLHYTVSAGASVNFKASDFNTICTRATDGKLDYVRFQLPAASRGKLYYRYGSNSSSRGTVSASTSYYYDTTGSNKLNNVYFTAADSFSGTVSIDYTGFSTSGARFTGTVEIGVSSQGGSNLFYTITSEPFSIPGGEVFSACAPLLDRDVSYVRFTSLPKAGEGRLYYDYVGYNTGSAVSTATRYYKNQASYLDRVVFVPKEGFTGTVSLPYTAYDTRGGSVSGSVSLEVTEPTTSNYFTDMGKHVWAIPSVDFLYSSGAVEGVGSSQYAPASDYKRGDFVLVLYRVFNLRDAGTSSFSDVPQNKYYAAAIASAKAQNVVPGDGLFRPEEPITRQDAMLYLYNAMRATGKSVSAGSASELTRFADYNSVSDQTRTAVTAMVHMGIIQGDNYRRLNPTNPITRAEMAVVMHRAMTQ